MKDERKTKAQLIDELNNLRLIHKELETTHQEMMDRKLRYRDFLENIDDLCFETDLRGHTTYCNEAVIRLLGYTPEEYLGLSLAERHGSDEEAKRIFEIFNNIYRNDKGQDRFDSVLRRKDGTLVKIDTSALMIRNEQGRPIGFRGIARDVTERRNEEDNLKRYKEYLENINDGCYERSLNGAYRWFNDAIFKHSGFTPEDVAQMAGQNKFMSREDIERIQQAYQKVSKTGVPEKVIINQLLKKDGGYYSAEMYISLVVDSEGKATGYRIISRDITERVKAEQELLRYKDFVDNAADACFETDLNGKYIFFNDALCRHSRYSREELGQGIWRKQMGSRGLTREVLDTYQQVLRTGVPARMVSHELKKKDGTVYSIEVTITRACDTDGKPTGWRVISRDVTDQVKAQENLLRYKEFVENVDDGCFELDLNGKYVFVNDAMSRRSGYSCDELLAMDPPNTLLANKDDAEPNRRAYIKVYNTGVPQKISYPYVRKDGVIRHVENLITLMRDSKGNPMGFRGISRDVTEQIKTERERERSHTFIESIEDVCFENDLKGTITFFNSAMCKLLNVSPDDLMSKNYRQLFSEDTSARIYPIYNEIYRTGNTATFYDFEIIRIDGLSRYLDITIGLIRDANGNPAGFRGVAKDVTERFRMEREQTRYQDFLNNIDDYCFECDLNGTLIFANEKTLKLFGVTREQMRQEEMNYRKYLEQERADQYDQIYMEVYRTGNPAMCDINMTSSDGERRDFEMAISLIRSEEGTPSGFRMIARDVTRRKMMEEEQEKLKEKILQSEKLEAIGTLAGGIAHDFNNILMGIQGYTSLMLMDIDTDNPFYEQLKIIESQVKSGADLTKQLLGYARGGRYEMKVTDMNDLIRKTAYVFGRTKKDIRIHQDYADSLWDIEADQGQMEQVFLNLFVNAAEAMAGGGAIHLQTENVVLDEQYVSPHEVDPGQYIKVSVTDTGPGMDEKTRQRIFEPFFTTKDIGKGAGLGLASAYGIIKSHKGIVNCYSEIGYGTTFNIYLPATTARSVQEEERETSLESRPMTILLVDDERTITDVTSAMLKKLGHHVIVAHGGKEAVLSYRVNRDHIDLVIMDMIMPDVGGGEAIEQIKTINPDVKILLSSGYSINGMAREIMDRGGVKGFLQKPFQVTQLVDKINEILGK